MRLLMQPNLLRNLCFLPTKNTKYRTFYRTHFVLISITCLSRYISLSFYRPALTATERMCTVADRGNICIIHDQKLSYRTPLVHGSILRRMCVHSSAYKQGTAQSGYSVILTWKKNCCIVIIIVFFAHKMYFCSYHNITVEPLMSHGLF